MNAAIDKRQVRRAFSRHGGGGDLFSEIASRLASRLDEIAPKPRWIVDVGGDGAVMRARFPDARILAADFALPRLQKQPHVFRTQADAEYLPVRDAAADLLWSNLCFEWTDMQKSLAEAARALRPQTGLLIFSVLGRDTLQEARTVFAKNRTHAFMDMHDIGDLLAGGGFTEPVLETEHITLTYPDAAAALREIHAAGCGCALQSRARGMLGRNTWRAALAEYARRFAAADGQVPATYEIIYAVSWRKPPPGEQVMRFAPRRKI